MLYVVDAAGGVVCTDATGAASEQMARSARRAVAVARFEPFVIDGERVPFLSRLTIRYRTRQ